MRLVLGIALLLLAGCVAPAAVHPASDAVTDVEARASAVIQQSHDHADAKAHALAVNVRELGHAVGFNEKIPDGAVYGEEVVKGGFTFLVYENKPGPVATVESGFFVFNTSDPENPRVIANVPTQASGADIDVSDDGHWLFLSTQRNGYPYTESVSASNGPEGEFPRGTYIYDITDKAHPKFESFNPLPPNGPHTITYYNDHGRELLLENTYDILFTVYPQNVGQNQLSQKTVITELTTTPTGQHVLKPLAIYQRLVPDDADHQRFPHDAFLAENPITHTLVMYVAYWDTGMVLVDMSDPSNPKELSTFADVAPSHLVHAHSVKPFPALVGGKVVAVIEPEIPTGDETSQFTFVDVTDPAHPQKLGYWKIPGNLTVDSPFIFSPHNFDTRVAPDGRALVALSHNYGGLWVLDATDPTSPRAIAFYQSDDSERANRPVNPGFGTVFFQGEDLVAPEYDTGLYTLALVR